MPGWRFIVAILAAIVASAAAPAASRAQAEFPSRPVKMIVPYPPGGGTDLLARVLAQQLGQKWKQSVIVENVGGAGGNIGAEEVARAAPDGYTLLFASPGPLATNSFMYKSMPYDPAKWTPIAVVATSPYVLAVSPHFDASTIAQVIADARAEPGGITSATPGIGSLGQFATIEFEMLAKVKLLQVPYKGLSPAVDDVLAGNVNMMFDMMATARPLFEAGREKIVAVGASKRVAGLPDVPTLAEAGVPGYRAVTFFGIVAPPGTPDALADKINADIAACMREPLFIEKTKALGMDLAGGSRAEAGKFFADERALWGKVAKSAGIKPAE
ncbi:MAG: Bug family tripartite tricarboxylate transporter substrate binding protein [Xanthobacteraceae bacterium]